MCELNSTADMIVMQAGVFDSLRPSGSKLFLLKHSPDTRKFSVVSEITSGWFVIFDKEFRDEMKVLISTAADIRDLTAQSSYIGYGVGASGNEIDVYKFENKDTTKLTATSPNWKIYATRDSQYRFLLP